MRAEIAPTPRDEIFRNGTAKVYRFRGDDANEEGRAVLLVPSLINRWYVLDLRPGTSMVEALLDRGFDVYCLDWGVPNDEDRYLEWDHVLDRLRRSIRATRQHAPSDDLGLLGYCMGGTLCAIHLALHPDDVDTYINLTAPIDFSNAGTLGRFVDERWFDAESLADAGNIAPRQMQAGFIALRPTGQIAKWVTLADRADNADYVKSFHALESWVNDNIPFPAAAYETYIGDLYQDNALVKGEHRVRGRRVDLSNIDLPLLSLAADYDNICPPDAARALNEHASSEISEFDTVSGGHVGAVVGSKGPTELYPKIGDWFDQHLAGA